MFCITKWCKSITDSGKDEYTGRKKNMEAKLLEKYGKIPPLFRFRLLDDDETVYCYGVSTSCDDDAAFAPLDKYEYAYGCTIIEYKNEKGEWEQL